MDIYIANLRKGVSPERLRHSFGHLGDVSSVRIVFSADEKHEKDFAVISLVPLKGGNSVKQVEEYGISYSIAV